MVHGSRTNILLISLLLTLFLPLVCISIYIYRTLAVMVVLVQMSSMMYDIVECVEGMGAHALSAVTPLKRR